MSRGDSVLVIDNYATGRRDNLAPRPALEVVEGSIADSELVDEAVRRFKPDVCVHAAAAYKDPDDWAEDSRTNVLGTANVVRACGREGVGRLIYFQTALCYGLHPLEQPITLEHPLRPEGSSYAISKTAGEHYLALGSLDWVAFRLANAYGPRNISGPLPTFFQRLTAGKPCFVMETRRDFIYVQDLVDVVVKAVDGVVSSGPTTSRRAPTTRSSSCSMQRLPRSASSSTRTLRCDRATRTTLSRSCSTRRKRSVTSTGR